MSVAAAFSVSRRHVCPHTRAATATKLYFYIQLRGQELKYAGSIEPLQIVHMIRTYTMVATGIANSDDNL